MLSMTSANTPGAGREALGRQLTQNAFWLIRLRWIAGAAIIVGTILASRLGIVTVTAQLLAIAGVVLAYNALISLAVRRDETRSLGSSQAFLLVQIVADLFALSGIVYFCGGLESPIAIFYVFHMVCSGILLSPRLSYLIATLASGLFALLAVVQAASPSLYHPLGLSDAGRHFSQWPFVALTLCAFTVAMYASVYLTITITNRLRATEEQIMRQRDVLDSIISSMSEVLVFLAPDGTPLVWNSAGQRWFLKGDGAGGQAGAAESALPKGLAEYIDRVRQARAPLPTETFWVAAPTGDDRPGRQFRACASGVLDDRDQHLGYVIVAEDLTEQLQLEQDLREQNREVLAMSRTLQKNQDEMAQHEKMVAVGTMAAGVAHEVGNPLACLSAIVQLLGRRTRPAEDTKHLETLAEQIGRITNILRQLLDFARPDTNEQIPVDLDALVEQTVKMVGYSHRSRHAQIESIPNRGLPRVCIAPDQFQQVLINVILNALDAMRDIEGKAVMTVTRSAEDDWVHVKVIDRGVGMTERESRQVFEPFYTTKPPGQGTGLGLAVSYRIVQQQGGRIRIDSKPGEGTVVTMSFPAIRTPVQSPPPAGGKTTAAR